jgi:hypothetical protein
VALSRSRRTRSWLSASRLVAGVAFRVGGVDGGGGRPVRERPVGPVVVVGGDERVEEALQVSGRGGLVGLAACPH